MTLGIAPRLKSRLNDEVLATKAWGRTTGEHPKEVAKRISRDVGFNQHLRP